MLHHPMIAAMCDDQEGRTSMVGSEPRLRLELYSDMLLACSMNKVSFCVLKRFYLKFKFHYTET